MTFERPDYSQDTKWAGNALLIIAVIVLVFVSVAAFAAPADNGWKVYRTFEYNIILWEKETRENFIDYAIENGSGATICAIPYVHGNQKTRAGLSLVNRLPAGAFHEIGFVTYTTGSKPGSAHWAVTLILLENQCSLPSSDPQPMTVPTETLS